MPLSIEVPAHSGVDVCAEDVMCTKGKVSRDVTVSSGWSYLSISLTAEHRSRGRRAAARKG